MAVDGPTRAEGEEGLKGEDEAFVDSAALGKILPGGDLAWIFVEGAADAVAREKAVEVTFASGAGSEASWYLAQRE